MNYLIKRSHLSAVEARVGCCEPLFFPEKKELPQKTATFEPGPNASIILLPDPGSLQNGFRILLHFLPVCWRLQTEQE
jgi:hypothetical protein